MADYDHQMLNSGALIGSNDDLLTEILRRLPLVSILRFKSVSKRWRSLLSRRHFTLMCYDGSISPGFFVRNTYIPYDVENQSSFPCLDFYPDHRRIKIVQSCNGLLLCSSDRGDGDVRSYCVINLATKQGAFIPQIIGDVEVQRSVRLMGLAFHQTDCLRYKVICIYRKKEHEQLLGVQIYSSETGKWKKASSIEHFWMPYYTPFSGGVYWNGSFLWAPSCILPDYLNLQAAQIQKLPLPSPLPTRVESFNGYKDGARPLYFGESRGHLHLVDTNNHENYLHLNVYEMLSDHSGWFVKYQVELDNLGATYPEIIQINQQHFIPVYYIFKILDVVRGEDEEDEDSFLVVKVSKSIIRYNIFDKSFKKIFELTNELDQSIGPWDVHRYTPTMTSI